MSINPVRVLWSKSIQHRLALLISLLVVTAMFALGLLFYLQFRHALNQRVLLQLSSIRQLKKVQIEEYLAQQSVHLDRLLAEDSILPDIAVWPEDSSCYSFQHDSLGLTAKMRIFLSKQTRYGRYDLTHLSVDGSIFLAYVLPTEDGKRIVFPDRAPKIQEILLERTGMGETGETYIVGPDGNLRTKSRFFPDTPPYEINANTMGVQEAVDGKEGAKIFKDYRDVKVFSSYGPLLAADLHWVILSEIDEVEALQPLAEVQRRLLFISILLVGLTIFGSFQLASLLVRPLVKMKDLLKEMARGNFDVKVPQRASRDEIQDMFQALDQLVDAVNRVRTFASQIGAMELEEHYELLSEQDALGKSLLNMREKLKAFNKKEEAHQLLVQKSILQGQEKERARLSKELHDGMGPVLTSLKLMIQQHQIPEEEKRKIRDLLDETITEVRRMTYNLMPQALIDFGVGQSLARLVDMVSDASKIDIVYVNDMMSDSHLALDVHVGLYRIAQEALNNSIKHSKASEIHLSLTEFPDRISFFFRDNGSGFDTTKNSVGSGLLNMRERSRVLGGTFEMKSNEEGTTIEIEIPHIDD
ncbi:MAG: HAMP domain-containing protein [Saprospiraceae bacterium]|nr:HAMP domain-containing protein [Saprospiraceae bacterium]